MSKILDSFTQLVDLFAQHDYLYEPKKHNVHKVIKRIASKNKWTMEQREIFKREVYNTSKNLFPDIKEQLNLYEIIFDQHNIDYENVPRTLSNYKKLFITYNTYIFDI